MTVLTFKVNKKVPYVWVVRVNKQARVLVKVQTASDGFTITDSALTARLTAKIKVWGLFKR